MEDVFKALENLSIDDLEYTPRKKGRPKKYESIIQDVMAYIPDTGLDTEKINVLKSKLEALKNALMSSDTSEQQPDTADADIRRQIQLEVQKMVFSNIHDVIGCLLEMVRDRSIQPYTRIRCVDALMVLAGLLQLKHKNATTRDTPEF